MILFHVIELDKDIKGPFTNPFDQLKEYGVTIIKKSLISTKKQQDRGKKMNGLVLVPPKCVNLDQLAIIKKMYEHKLKAISLIIIFLVQVQPK